MGHVKTNGGRGTRALLGLCATALFLLCAFASSALALPSHAHLPALDVEGLDHACGAAVDSKGDFYASSAGESKINVYSTVNVPSPHHELLTSIVDTHEPCGLAVTTTGNVYVSEKATGKVIRFHPSEYPPTGSTTYSETTIDASGNAKGIAVDRTDNRLYVAEGTKVAVYKSDGSFETNVGEAAGLTNATGVAPYTYPAPIGTDRYLWVADASGSGKLDLFAGPSVGGLKLRRELDGSSTPNGSFDFGSAGTYLAADPGNRTAENSEAKCTPVSVPPVGEQACTAGHLFLYDAGDHALDEFDASGEYLDQTKSAAFADAEPSGVAIDRSGSASDGTIYLTAHSLAGDKALAYGPLGAPKRGALGAPISKVLPEAAAVATDSHGYVYAAAGPQIHIYKPDGTGLGAIVVNAGKEEEKGLIEDPHNPWDLAVDSSGKVYVLDKNKDLAPEAEVTYYTPSAYPPKADTTYTRHEPLVTPKDFPAANILKAIAVDPGPGPGKDRLFVTSFTVTHLYKSAANGSGLLDGEFAKGFLTAGNRQSIAVNGANGNVYIGANENAPLIAVLSPDGKEIRARIDEAGGPKGPGGFNPYVAVDQANGHMVEFDGARSTAREYDSSGSFVAEFGSFTEHVTRLYRVAIDSACAIHVNETGEPEPLDETTTPTCHNYDPADGTAYVAWDDTNPNHPPYDVSAFGPLTYPSVGEAPLASTGAADEFGPGAATLHGTVNPKGSLLEKCRFEYLTDAEYQGNKEGHPGDEEAAFEGAETKACAESPAQIGEGNAAVAVHAEVGGLADVPYRFRLLTANAGGNGAGQAVLFGPPSIAAKSAVAILYHEATLRAQINPSGLGTEYRFEYLDRQSFEAQGGFEGPATHHTDLGQLAAGEAPVSASAVAPGLTEGTEYLFRAVAKNAFARTPGAAGTFVTQTRRSGESCANAEYRFGLSANLPDCRAYELITPAETNGALVTTPFRSNLTVGFNNWLTAPRGAGAGEAFSYEATTTLPGFEGSGAIDGYRAERGAGAHPAAGWGTSLVSPSYVQGGGNGNGAEALDGSPDQLYSLWLVSPLPSFEGSLAKGTYLRTPAGFEAAGRGSLGTDPEATSQFVSAGGAHVLFSSSAHLEAGAPAAPNVALYDRAAGSSSAQVLTLAPNGSAEEEAEFLAALGSKEQAKFAGWSEDGAAVAFRTGPDLYLRLDDASTERVSPHTAQVGDTLGCVAGPLHEGQTTLPARGIRWLRNGATIPGVGGDDVNSKPEEVDYTPKPADAGTALQCLTIATAANPRSVAVSSPVWISPLAPAQAPQPPAQIAPPTPASPAVNTLETCNPGSWTGAQSLAYQWYDNGEAIAGATSQTYKVLAANVPGRLQCIVTGSNAAAKVARASGLTPTSPAPAQAAPVATALAAPKTTYAGLSEDGRYAFFAFGDGASPGRLFRFDTQSEAATEIAAAGIFVDVSPDGSRVLFSSTQALTESKEENENHEHAEATRHNLYVWDSSGVHFVAILDPQDLIGFGGEPGTGLGTWTEAITAGLKSGFAESPARSTPNGGVFAFQSHAQLSAYDNEGFSEIYRYAPTAPGGERLICVSCDPTGAPPGGDAMLEVGFSAGLDVKTIIPNLSDDGKEVFFQSPDRLLPEDANEAEDVYEWKAKGTGAPECTRPGGCLALISSGQGETPSFLYAMSADGHDVFFRTQERLLGSDVAGSPSLYDARVGGGIPEPSPPAPCQGDACQGVGTLPPNLPAPASTGGGEGGGEASSPPPSSCAKGKHRVKGRCVAAKRHKRHAKKHRGANTKRGGKR